MTEKSKVLNAMIDYFKNDPKRINHFIKVHSFAMLICDMEDIDDVTRRTIELASIVHDIGIKNSEIKYGSSSGKYQQIEGPEEAKKILDTLGIEEEIIERCCWLIAHHHTYNHILEIDHQILVEADFIVNIYEDEIGAQAIDSIKENIFKTEAGSLILSNLFGF